ncbi:MAG: zinc-ribbon domain-containing protein [Chloroflexi bacterium]|nr:zinc-ribbon domain-containing protein [Chloroflexota bacterium]
MVLALGLVLTVAVVVYVGYPLFARQSVPVEDALELAIAQRRGKVRAAVAEPRASAGVTCPACGARNQADDKFCARCGRSLAQAQCARCGTAYDEGDVFCAKCGAPLNGRSR